VEDAIPPPAQPVETTAPTSSSSTTTSSTTPAESLLAKSLDRIDKFKKKKFDAFWQPRPGDEWAAKCALEIRKPGVVPCTKYNGGSVKLVINS